MFSYLKERGLREHVSDFLIKVCVLKLGKVLDEVVWVLAAGHSLVRIEHLLDVHVHKVVEGVYVLLYEASHLQEGRDKLPFFLLSNDQYLPTITTTSTTPTPALPPLFPLSFHHD